MADVPPAKELPFDVESELDGWHLFWALLEIERRDDARLAELRDEAAATARQRFPETAALATHPTVAALRKLFRAAGCDPTRYRPSSEALLRRLVKGHPLPAIQPLVDVGNCLSAELAVPCCVMVEDSFGTALTLRSGRAGEAYVSLRGPFKLEGKPLLADQDGPLDTPITGNERVKVLPETRRAWLVAYLPRDVVAADEAWACLERLRRRGGLAAERFTS